MMVWIYGGAFAMGSTATPLYDGDAPVQEGRSGGVRRVPRGSVWLPGSP